jgi:hypothetical protein
MKWLFMLMCGLVLLAGCRVVQPVQHTFEKTDSVIIREKMVPVNIPATEVTSTLSKSQLDSLTLALRSMPANNKTIYLNDPTLRTRLSFALDSLGKLIIRCESIEQLYMAKLQEKDHYLKIKDLEIREVQKTFGEKIKNYFNTILWTIIIALVLIAIVNFLLFKIRR